MNTASEPGKDRALHVQVYDAKARRIAAEGRLRLAGNTPPPGGVRALAAYLALRESSPLVELGVVTASFFPTAPEGAGDPGRRADGSGAPAEGQQRKLTEAAGRSRSDASTSREVTGSSPRGPDGEKLVRGRLRTASQLRTLEGVFIRYLDRDAEVWAAEQPVRGSRAIVTTDGSTGYVAAGNVVFPGQKDQPGGRDAVAATRGGGDAKRAAQPRVDRSRAA